MATRKPGRKGISFPVSPHYNIQNVQFLIKFYEAHEESEKDGPRMERTAGNRTRTVPRKHRHWNYYIRTFISSFNMSKELTETLSKIERKDSTPTLKGLASLYSHPHNKKKYEQIKNQ